LKEIIHFIEDLAFRNQFNTLSDFGPISKNWTHFSFCWGKGRDKKGKEENV